jgi:two-component system response regulator RegA
METHPPAVLVVDGDPGHRQGLQDLLHQEGYTALLAATGAEARDLALGLGHEPALVIAELVLGDGSGVHLIRDLRGAWPGLPALIVTSCIEPQRIVEAMRAGADDYLPKPVPAETLVSACRSALANRPSVDSDAAAHLRPLREIEDAYIDRVLAATGGNRTRAARILGVARETLRTRMLARTAP